MEAKQKQILLGSIAGVLLLVAAVLIWKSVTKPGPEPTLAPEVEAAARTSTEDLAKKQEKVAAEATEEVDTRTRAPGRRVTGE